MIIKLKKTAAMRTQVGTGLRRRRLSSPISRRFTIVMAKMLKQADMIP